MASPNNPIGNYLNRVELKSLISLLPDQVVLVLDEVYHHYVDASDYATAVEFMNLDKNIIGLNSFSKVYGLAGLRLGYGYTSVEIANYLQILCKPFALSSLVTAAGIAALQDIEFVAQTVKNNLLEKQYLYDQFEALGLKYWPTQANFILIKPGTDTLVFEREMLRLGIMVRPVDNFGAEGCVRVTIGRHDQNVRFIGALKVFLEKNAAIPVEMD